MTAAAEYAGPYGYGHGRYAAEGGDSARLARVDWTRWSVVLLKPDCLIRGLVEQVLACVATEVDIVARETITVTQTQIFAHYDDLLESPERFAPVDVAADLRRRYVEGRVEVALGHGAPAGPGRADTPARLRAMLGHYDPARARGGTIRGDFGVDSFAKARRENRLIDNLIHTSDNPDAARRDFVIWFGADRTHLLFNPHQ